MGSRNGGQHHKLSGEKFIGYLRRRDVETLDVLIQELFINDFKHDELTRVSKLSRTLRLQWLLS